MRVLLLLLLLLLFTQTRMNERKDPRDLHVRVSFAVNQFIMLAYRTRMCAHVSDRLATSMSTDRNHLSVLFCPGKLFVSSPNLFY